MLTKNIGSAARHWEGNTRYWFARGSRRQRPSTQISKLASQPSLLSGIFSNRHVGYERKVNLPKGAIVPLWQRLHNIAHGGNRLTRRRRKNVATRLFGRLWSEDEGQDIAEYAVMLAVILVIVVGTVRLIGGNSNNVFSSVASSIGS